MSMNAVTPVDERSFERAVESARGQVLVDFTAERCAPCRALLPVVTRIAESSGPELRVLKVDVDASPELAVRFRIRGIPTLVVLSRGREVARHVGSANEARVRALLASDDDGASAV